MKFYGHFAAAYGTIWLVLVGFALIMQSHIDAGAFGLLGFPVIALIYASIRIASARSPNELELLRRRVAQLELEQELAGRAPAYNEAQREQGEGEQDKGIFTRP
jgi:hypothetical protein